MGVSFAFNTSLHRKFLVVCFWGGGGKLGSVSGSLHSLKSTERCGYRT